MSIQLPLPDDSIAFFQALKQFSEHYWQTIVLNNDIYGFQIQQGSLWKQGLTEEELVAFEQELGIFFPEALKNFYRCMNGLDRPAVNVYGESGEPYAYQHVFYSYPDDIPRIKEMIKWIEESNDLSHEEIQQEEIPAIFPIVSHRFLILDDHLQILSMYGNDIIFWADNISKLLATHIFKHIENQAEFKSHPDQAKPIDFWL